MEMIVKILIGIVAFIHVGFLIMQMFLWDKPFVQGKLLKDFTSEEIATILAHNQGLYNGFLAAGLILVLFIWQIPQVEPNSILNFFLICIVIAGIYGSITLKRPTAFLLQSLPAALALVLLWLPRG